MAATMGGWLQLIVSSNETHAYPGPLLSTYTDGMVPLALFEELGFGHGNHEANKMLFSSLQNPV
jgi:hypothetical protein